MNENGRVTNGKVYEAIGELRAGLDAVKDTCTKTCEDRETKHKELLTAIQDARDDFMSEMSRHMAYHEKNEEKWGVSTWMKNHMRQTITITVLFVLAILGGFGLLGPKAWAWVEKVNKMIP